VLWEQARGGEVAKGFICRIARNEEALQAFFTEDDHFFMVETVDVSHEMK